MLKACFFYLFTTTVGLYFWMSFFGIDWFAFLAILLLPLLAILKLRSYFDIHFTQITSEHLVVTGLIFFEICTLLFVLSPLVLTQTINGFKFYEFTGINDYYKHVYAITAILNRGLPPVHPYYPNANLSYYYGYYLIPAAIAKVTGVGYNVVMWLYPPLTIALTLAFLYSLSKLFITSKWVRILMVIVLITGTGLDIVPTLKINSPNIRHIESWSQELNLGLIVNNTFMSYLWVPQHVLAALALIYLAYLLHKEKLTILNFILVSTGLVYIGLTSFFVAITAVLWLGLFFLKYPEKRYCLILSGVCALALALPYLSQLSNRANLFYFYTPGFYTFITSQALLNRLLNIIVEYGPLALISLLAIPNGYIGLAMLLPILITWFIRTPGPNDFGMRSILPIQLLVPMAVGMIYEKLKSPAARVIFLLILAINLGFSAYGYLYEHVNSWKDRRILTVEDSQLITWARKLPKETKLAAYQKENWAFYIPPLGWKTLLSPHLYDSGVYIAGNIGSDHGVFETMGRHVFEGTVFGKTPSDVILARLEYWSYLAKYLAWSPFDYFVITQKEWVKKGVNPWFYIFNQMKNKPDLIGDKFAAYQFAPLVSSVEKYDLQIAKLPKKIVISGNAFTLDRGLWYIVGCNTKAPSSLILDLEDYFSLFKSQLDVPGCIGTTLLVSDSDPIRVVKNYSVSQLSAYKVTVVPK